MKLSAENHPLDFPNLLFGNVIRQRPPRPSRNPEWQDPRKIDNDTARLADLLHDTQCHASHVDECGYQYEGWDDPRWAKTGWYRGAERMVRESGQSADVVVAVLQAAKSWIIHRGRSKR